MLEFTNIYSCAICTLFHSKAVKAFQRKKMYPKIVIYHQYPPKYCIPKIKPYMHLNSKRSILRHPLIPLVRVFRKPDFTMWSRLVGKSLCLLLSCLHTHSLPAPGSLVPVLQALPLHEAGLCICISSTLVKSRLLMQEQLNKSAPYLPMLRHKLPPDTLPQC